MAKKTVRRSVDESHTLRLSSAEVVLMLREAGYVPESIPAADVEFEAATETGAVVSWHHATSSTEDTGQ